MIKILVDECMHVYATNYITLLYEYYLKINTVSKKEAILQTMTKFNKIMKKNEINHCFQKHDSE